MSKVFSGEKLFELKATHGLPLDVSLSEIMVKAGHRVNWPEFLETARKNGRWDFQTIPDIEVALMDAEVDRLIASEIVARCKEWVVANPIIEVLHDRT